MNRDRPLLAVLIDADNVPAKFADAILDEIAGIGEPAIRRVYADWTNGNLSTWAKKIPELGLTARQETANTTGKNASDIGLVIDAMDILHAGKCDGFVLVSSDSDFTALGSRLREDGLSVIGIGEKKTPPSLRNVCNRFIFIENLKKLDASEATASEPLSSALALIRDAIDHSSNSGDWHDLAYIGAAVISANPDFDTRSYGYPKLSALVKAIPELEVKQTDTTLMIRLRS